jgi:capsular polysaccharide transport system permease protein
MMHGKFDLAITTGGPLNSIIGRILAFPMRHRRWLMIVVLPTLLVASYLWLIAADQYESEAHFLVRSTESSAQPSGLGQALSLIGGVGSAPSDATSVSDYLSSHDAVDRLRADQNLVDRFRRPEADWLSKLRPDNPSPERLLRYYRDQVDVKLEGETGITAIKVRAFRPDDSYDIVNALLRLGEERVNTLNQRAYASALRMAQKQLHEAEADVGASQDALTAFRQQRRNIDPVATGQSQIGLVTTIRTNLAQARAARASLSGSVSPSSPQARALDARIRALEAQVNAEASRLTGGSSAIAANVGDYQSLQLKQQFAARRYDAAASALQRAREQAQKQQLFVVRVVEPNMPVKALYPKRAKIAVTVFISLALAYALGWLIVAGVREHAA